MENEIETQNQNIEKDIVVENKLKIMNEEFVDIVFPILKIEFDKINDYIEDELNKKREGFFTHQYTDKIRKIDEFDMKYKSSKKILHDKFVTVMKERWDSNPEYYKSLYDKFPKSLKYFSLNYTVNSYDFEKKYFTMKEEPIKIVGEIIEEFIDEIIEKNSLMEDIEFLQKKGAMNEVLDEMKDKFEEKDKDKFKEIDNKLNTYYESMLDLPLIIIGNENMYAKMKENNSFNVKYYKNKEEMEWVSGSIIYYFPDKNNKVENNFIDLITPMKK
jgi:hypothetical protein